MASRRTSTSRGRLALAAAAVFAVSAALTLRWGACAPADAAPRGSPVLAAGARSDAASGDLPGGGGASPQPLGAPGAVALGNAAPAPAPDSTGLDDPWFAGVPASWTRPFTVRGRVVDARGTPLADATVVLLCDRLTADIVSRVRGAVIGPAEGWPRAAGPTTSTDADGRLELVTRRGLHGAASLGRETFGLNAAVLVDDPRCLLFRRECPDEDVSVSDVGTLVVEPGAELRGRVVDEAGRPLAGVNLRLSVDASGAGTLSQRWSDWDQLPESSRTAETDAAGSYAFHSVWPGDGRVWLEADDAVRTSVYLEPWGVGARIDVPDLVFAGGRGLLVQVVDERGQPLDDATVLAIPATDAGDPPDPERLLASRPYGSRHPRSPATRLDAGLYAPRGLLNEEHVLVATAPGRSPQALKGQWPDGPLVTLTLPVAPPGRDTPFLEVSVVDEGGAPLAAATIVTAFAHPELHADTHVVVVPLGPGRFGVGIGPSTDVVACVEAPGFASTRVPVVAPPAPPLRVALVPETTLSGAVRDERGAPVPHAVLRLVPDGKRTELGVVREVVADAQGGLTTGGLSAGWWALELRGDGVLDTKAASREGRRLQLQAGERRTGLVFTLQRTGALEGLVRDSAGRLPEDLDSDDVVLEAPPDAVSSPDLELQPDGAFVARHVLPGEYVLRGPRGASTGVTIVAGETRIVTLVIPRPPQLRASVHAGGRPVAGARVQWRPRQEGLQRARDQLDELPVTDAAGCVTFDCGAGGEILVRALLPGGGASESVSAFLTPDMITTVELPAGTGRIQGVATDAVSRAPLKGASVRLDGGQEASTDETGAFTIEGVPAGSHELVASKEGFFDARVPAVSVAPGQAVKGQRLALDPACALDITVLAPDGEPARARVAIWRCELVPGERQRWTRLLDLQGDARSSGRMRADRYRLSVYEPDAGEAHPGADALDRAYPAALTVELSPGETREVVLRIDVGH